MTDLRTLLDETIGHTRGPSSPEYLFLTALLDVIEGGGHPAALEPRPAVEGDEAPNPGGENLTLPEAILDVLATERSPRPTLKFMVGRLYPGLKLGDRGQVFYSTVARMLRDGRLVEDGQKRLRVPEAAAA